MLGSRADEWHRYKTLKWAWFISVLGYLPVPAVSSMIARRISGPDSGNTVFGITLVLWFLSSGALNHLFTSWPCPRCGKPFINNGNWAWFTKSCVHCGLLKYSDPLRPTDT